MTKKKVDVVFNFIPVKGNETKEAPAITSEDVENMVAIREQREAKKFKNRIKRFFRKLFRK